MVSVDQALELIAINSTKIESEIIPLKLSVRRILLESVHAQIDMPPFDQSAMDGYALCPGEENYRVIGECKAGSKEQYYAEDSRSALRIFTGAPVPKDFSTVVKQESTERNGQELIVTEQFGDQENIRFKGEQYRKGDLLVAGGTKLTPGIIGLLATNGITEVSVSKLPKVGILTTGDELAHTGEKLKAGQVYESNTVMLESALQQLGIQPVVKRVKDNLSATVAAMSILIEECDLVLTSGGISVGDHDHIYSAAEKNEIKEIFYKVQQKPGKPLFFGRKNDTLIFGLPGNPASALTCFYVYVSKALEVMTQSPTPFYKRSTLPLQQSYLKKGTFTNFLKAQVDQDSVSPLSGQSSAMLQTMTDANAIMIVPATKNQCKKGELFEVILID